MVWQGWRVRRTYLELPQWGQVGEGDREPYVLPKGVLYGSETQLGRCA